MYHTELYKDRAYLCFHKSCDSRRNRKKERKEIRECRSRMPTKESFISQDEFSWLFHRSLERGGMPRKSFICRSSATFCIAAFPAYVPVRRGIMVNFPTRGGIISLSTKYSPVLPRYVLCRLKLRRGIISIPDNSSNSGLSYWYLKGNKSHSRITSAISTVMSRILDVAPRFRYTVRAHIYSDIVYTCMHYTSRIVATFSATFVHNATRDAIMKINVMHFPSAISSIVEWMQTMFSSLIWF